MGTLTTGAFLAGYALLLGANNLTIGLLSAIPAFMNVTQIAAVYLFEKQERHKPLTVLFSLGSRLAWLGVAFSVLWGSPQIALVALMAGLAVHSLCAAGITVGWNSWMRELIPDTLMGRVFSIRLRYGILAALVVSLVAGYLLNQWNARDLGEPRTVYAWVFFAAAAMGMAGVFLRSRVPEPVERRRQGGSFVRLLLQPLRDRNYRALLLFLGLWNFAIQLAVPFFAIYMLRRLGLSISVVIVLMAISQLCNALSMPVWGRLSDKFGSKEVLHIGGILMVLFILAFIFTGAPDGQTARIALLVPLHVVGGIATAAVTLATNNIALKLAPHGSATAYMGASGLTNSIGAGFAPIIAGILGDFFASHNVQVTIGYGSEGQRASLAAISFRGLDFVFFLAFAIGTLALLRLAFVREEGHATEHVRIHHLLEETGREFRTVTSLGGVRHLMAAPYYLLGETLWRSEADIVEGLKPHVISIPWPFRSRRG